MARWGLCVVVVLLVLLTPLGRARAHTIGLSTGEYTPRDSSLVVKLAFARAELAALAPAIDSNRDGHVTPAEMDAARSILEKAVLGRIVVVSGGAPCVATLTDAGLMEQDGLLLTGRFDCPSSDAPFEVDLALLDALPNGHRHIARTVTGASTHDEVLDRTHRKLSIAPASSSASATSSSAAGSAEGTHDPSSGFRALFGMGLTHILSGYDHLLFLLALVLVPTRPRSLLAVITAFTVAHSITLALATLHVLAPPSRIVEPAIALSIVYVAIENFFVGNGSKRWRITFPFGLVHGFGFAGALQEIALPRSAVPTALVAFNLGVEAGQLAVLAVLVPLIALLRNTRWFERWGLRSMSGAIAIVGVIWFFARVFTS